MNKRFLPIGTVVLLKGGTKEVMIDSYCVFPNNVEIKDGKEVKPERKMYEYGACIYPEGILNSDVVYVFNHDQIAKICYMGYETDNQKELSEILDKEYEKYKLEYENESQ